MRVTLRAVALLTAALLAAIACAGVAAAAQRPGPWTQSNYTPRSGDWRPYVEAPSSHTVRPVSVLSVDPRGGSIEGDPNAVLGRGGSVRLVSNGDRTQSPLLVIDFGKEVAGNVQIHVQGASDPRPQLHACFSESKEFMAVSPLVNNGESAFAPGCDVANIFNGYFNSYTWDSDSHTLPLSTATLPGSVTDPQLRGGFRYLTLFLDGPGSVDISGVTLHYTAAPLQRDPAAYKGWFLSNDNTLNKIWYAGAYTVQIDTGMSNTGKSWPYATGQPDTYDTQIPNADPNQEVIFDGGKRDRDVWQGDLSVQAPVTYLSTDDTGAVDNSLSALAAQQLPDGYVPAEGLAGPHNTGEERTYGEYVTWFVNNMAVHYQYTGDKAYLDKWYPALTRAMAFLESVRAQDPQGLISFASDGSCGHYGYSDCGHETYINALYYQNLKQMAVLARAEGQDAQAAQYESTAAQVKSDINSQLWDSSVGAYSLSRETPEVFPQDANAAAILTGVADDAQARSALAYLRANNWSTLGSLTVGTPNAVIPTLYEPLPMGFEVQARLTGSDPSQLQADSALQLMRRYWGWQLTQDPQSTFWEKTATDGTPGLDGFTSLAHGWASAPTVALSTQVLGISPVTAGYARWSIVPHPGGLVWAQGAVPTPHGSLGASWRSEQGSFELSFTAPAHTSGEVGVPTFGRQVRVTVDGRVVWNAGRSEADGAHSDGSFVYLEGIGAGRHTIVSTARSLAPETVTLVPSPASADATPGKADSVQVDLAGESSSGPLQGTVTASASAGWTVAPASQRIHLQSDGRPVSQNLSFTVTPPSGAASGDFPVTFTYTDAHGTTATTHVDFNELLFGFEDGTEGWQAGDNVSSVATVSSFANGPGTPFEGTSALAANCTASAPASSPHTISVSPAQPIDLSASQTLRLYEDSYGGAPGASGYQTTVTLTAVDGQTLTKTFPTNNDSWNELDLDVSSWPDRNQVSQMSVSFQAVGSTTPWGCQFQIDNVGAM